MVALLLMVPQFTQAEDYISPSIMRIGQGITQETSSINFQNYSYLDKPFGNVTVNVSVSSYPIGKQVKHELSIHTSNPTSKYAAISVRPLYCKTGTDDCRLFECDSYSSYSDFRPYESKKKTCVITSDACAGWEIRVEYSMAGVSVTTKKTVKCPQSFCDQITMSVSAPEISYLGDRIFAEGYLSEMEKEGVASQVTVTAGFYSVNTSSNEFGYWSAPVEITRPGYYPLSAVSESCGRYASTGIQVLQKSASISDTGFFVYPKNIEVELGANALLAIKQDSYKSTVVSITGVPESWIEPAKFVMSRGIRFVYISPKEVGEYTVIVRNNFGEKNVSLFVAPEKMIVTKKAENMPVALLIFTVGLLFLFYSKTAAKSQTAKRKAYLDIVKKEIEDSG